MPWRDLFRVKSLDHLVGQHRATRPPAQARARPGSTHLLGVGAIVGAGIFSRSGRLRQAAASTVGAATWAPARPWWSRSSWWRSPAASPRSAIRSSPPWSPVSGSAYTYAYATLGELIAWIIGWDLILEYAVGNVAVAISWSDYSQSLLDGFVFPGRVVG